MFKEFKDAGRPTNVSIESRMMMGDLAVTGGRVGKEGPSLVTTPFEVEGKEPGGQREGAAHTGNIQTNAERRIKTVPALGEEKSTGGTKVAGKPTEPRSDRRAVVDARYTACWQMLSTWVELPTLATHASRPWFPLSPCCASLVLATLMSSPQAPECLRAQLRSVTHRCVECPVMLRGPHAVAQSWVPYGLDGLQASKAINISMGTQERHTRPFARFAGVGRCSCRELVELQINCRRKLPFNMSSLYEAG